MYRVNAQSLNGRKHNRSQNDDSWAGIHNHAENQEDDSQYGQNCNTGMEVAKDKCFNGFCRSCKREHTSECSCKCKYESQAAVCLNRFTEERNQLGHLNGFVDEQGNDNCIEYGKCRSLSWCNKTCIDTAENDYRAKQSPEAVCKQFSKSGGAQFLHSGVD